MLTRFFLCLFFFAAVTGLAFIVVLQADWGLLMFFDPMDSFLWLFINPEQCFAHLFDTSHGCWMCVFGIAFIFAYTIAIMFNLQIRSGFIFVLKCLRLDGTSYQPSGIVMVVLLFDVIPDCCTSCQYAGIVMPALFAYTVVMTYMISIASRGCTSDKVLARMFIIVPLIAIGFWPCILVIEFIFASTDVMLADVSLGGGIVLVMPLLFAVILGSTSCQYAGIVIVVPLLFALTAVITVFSIGSVSCPVCGSVIVMLLLFAFKAVIAYMFSMHGAQGCCTCDKVFARMFVRCTWIALECLACLFVISYVFAVTIAMKFILAGVSCCTSDESSIRIFVIDSWIVLGWWAGLLVVMTYMISIAGRGCTSGKVLARMFMILPLLIAIGWWLCFLGIMTFIFASTDVMLAVRSVEPWMLYSLS